MYKHDILSSQKVYQTLNIKLTPSQHCTQKKVNYSILYHINHMGQILADKLVTSSFTSMLRYASVTVKNIICSQLHLR